MCYRLGAGGGGGIIQLSFTISRGLNVSILHELQNIVASLVPP